MARAAVTHVSVVGTQEVRSVRLRKDGTRVPDVYTIEAHSSTWTVLRRFSSFNELHRMGKKSIPALPPRPEPGSYASLSSWLESLLADADLIRCVPVQLSQPTGLCNSIDVLPHDFLAQGRTIRRGKMESPAPPPVSAGVSSPSVLSAPPTSTSASGKNLPMLPPQPDLLQLSDKEKKGLRSSKPDKAEKDLLKPESASKKEKSEKGDKPKKDKVKSTTNGKSSGGSHLSQRDNDKESSSNSSHKDRDREKERDRDREKEGHTHDRTAAHSSSPHVSRRHMNAVERAASLDPQALASSVSRTREKRSGSYAPAPKESKEKEHANGGVGVRFRGIEEHDKEKTEKPKKSLEDSAKSEDDSANYGTVRIKDPEESNDAAFGTMRVKDSPPDSDEDEGSSSVLSSIKSSGGPDITVNVVDAYREPEAWELSIISFERGEYDPNSMHEDAWKKYRHNRPRLYSSFIKQPPDFSGMQHASPAVPPKPPTRHMK